MDWIRGQVGRRGAFLAFLALLDILYGYSILTIMATPPRLHLLLTYEQWGWAWLGVGVALLPGVFVRRDRFYYGLAAFLMAAWGGAWVDVWVSDPATLRAWVSVLVWFSFAGLVLVVSTWPEVRRLKGRDDG